MKINWIVVAIGCAAEIGAVLEWRHRDTIARITAEGQQAMFGDRSKRLQRGAKGKNIIYPAIGLAVIGLAAIAIGIFGGVS
jgi:hypothetical protein